MNTLFAANRNGGRAVLHPAFQFSNPLPRSSFRPPVPIRSRRWMGIQRPLNLLRGRGVGCVFGSFKAIDRFQTNAGASGRAKEPPP
jgi:hypothetical protein